MSEKEQWLNAVQHLKQYETYKLKKMWGIILVIIGIANFLSYILNLVIIAVVYEKEKEPFAFMRSMIYNDLKQVEVILILVPIMLSLLAASYLYLSVKYTSMTRNEISIRRYAFFGLAAILMNCLPFISANILYLREEPISYLWGGVIGWFLSYYLLTRVKNSRYFREMVYTGIILSFYATFVSIISIWDTIFNRSFLFNFSTLFNVVVNMSIVVFIIVLIITGCRVIQNASKTLLEA